MPSIETTAVDLGINGGLIQNLGPDAVYVGDSSVTDENGIEMLSGESISVGVTNTSIFAVSAGTSDVRVLPRVTGFFSRNPEPAP